MRVAALRVGTLPAMQRLVLNLQEDAKFWKEMVLVCLTQPNKKRRKLTPGVMFVGHMPPVLHENHIRHVYPTHTHPIMEKMGLLSLTNIGEDVVSVSDDGRVLQQKSSISQGKMGDTQHPLSHNSYAIPHAR
jgi:hypothetical protein